MTDYGCGRCDCHHEMVDFRLRKKPRSSSGATRPLARGRDHFLACRAGAATAGRSGPLISKARGRTEGAEQQDEVYLLNLRAERMGETGIFLFRFDTAYVIGETRATRTVARATVAENGRRTESNQDYAENTLISHSKTVI